MPMLTFIRIAAESPATIRQAIERRGRCIAQLGAPIPNAPSDAVVAGELRARMDRVRRRKDEIELARMRLAADATREAFAAIVPFIVPGTSERALQIEIEAAFFR